MQSIRGRDRNSPFFIFWAPHLVHFPLDIPKKYTQPWKDIESPKERAFRGMLTLLDEEVGVVTDLLRSEELWSSTLVIVHSDNGGQYGAGSNAPLRGGKRTNWEGGIRLAAFVSGGYLPASVHGATRSFLMHVSDWYATLAHLAGVDDITDHSAAKANLPPVDSMSAWSSILNDHALREMIVVGGSPINQQPGDAWVAGLISSNFKVLVGEHNIWPGHQPPWNVRELSTEAGRTTISCGRTPATGCMFDVADSPGETLNVAEQNPKLFRQMLRIMEEEQRKVFNPNRGEVQEELFCKTARDNGRILHTWLHELD